jgi:hypothetical protein
MEPSYDTFDMCFNNIIDSGFAAPNISSIRYVWFIATTIVDSCKAIQEGTGDGHS